MKIYRTERQKAADTMDREINQMVRDASEYGGNSQNWRNIVNCLELVRLKLRPEMHEDDRRER
jgi:hypothetical protein